MEAREIREMTTEEIHQRLNETHRELFNLRTREVTGRLEDYNRVTTLKRDIARMKTILRERELSGELLEGGEA